VFKAEADFASDCTALGLDLILFGADLQQLQGSNRYILLSYIGGEAIGLWKHKDLFLNSLKRYRLYGNGSIKLLDSNITLFTAGGILLDKEQEDVPELRRLFSAENGIIQSAYLNWNGHKCIKIGQSHIAGAWGKTATLEDVSDVCMVQLPKIPKKEGFLLLLRSGFPLREKLSVLTHSLYIYTIEGYL
jgi:hypothetical protein